MKLLFACLLLLLSQLGFSTQANLPPPVDIPIPNITQQTPVWCWAAVAQQIIAFKQGSARTPAQCALVALSYATPPQYCCMAQQQCTTTGNLVQIQQLLWHFGGSVSSYARPTDPLTLYATLAQRKPIIMAIKSPYSHIGHVVVIRGMHFQMTAQGPVAMLHVNDPMNYVATVVAFHQLAPMWTDAIVIHN